MIFLNGFSAISVIGDNKSALKEQIRLRCTLMLLSHKGPTLFLVFIYDILQNITTNIRLFADDTSLFNAATELNIELKNIYKWAREWLAV